MGVIYRVYKRIEDSLEKCIVFQKEFRARLNSYEFYTVGKLTVKVFEDKTTVYLDYLDKETSELQVFRETIKHDLLYGVNSRAIMHEISELFNAKSLKGYDINTVELLTPMSSNKLYFNEPIVVGRTLNQIFNDVYHSIMEDGE